MCIYTCPLSTLQLLAGSTTAGTISYTVSCFMMYTSVHYMISCVLGDQRAKTSGDLPVVSAEEMH